MIKEVFLSCLCVVGVLGARASQAESRRAESLAFPCMGCHGPTGRSRGEVPSLTGLDYAAFKQALEDFKVGARPATIMDRIAKGYTPEEIELLARYFGAPPATSERAP